MVGKLKKFVTAINCMDGRLQEPVIDYLKEKFKVEWIDMITEPGPVKQLEEKTNSKLFDSIKTRLDISVNNHGSVLIAIIAHHDCAGNPDSKENQLIQLENSVEFIKSLYPDIQVIGLWINDKWEVEEVF